MAPKRKADAQLKGTPKKANSIANDLRLLRTKLTNRSKRERICAFIPFRAGPTGFETICVRYSRRPDKEDPPREFIDTWLRIITHPKHGLSDYRMSSMSQWRAYPFVCPPKLTKLVISNGMGGQVMRLQNELNMLIYAKRSIKSILNPTEHELLVMKYQDDFYLPYDCIALERKPIYANAGDVVLLSNLTTISGPEKQVGLFIDYYPIETEEEEELSKRIAIARTRDTMTTRTERQFQPVMERKYRSMLAENGIQHQVPSTGIPGAAFGLLSWKDVEPMPAMQYDWNAMELDLVSKGAHVVSLHNVPVSQDIAPYSEYVIDAKEASLQYMNWCFYERSNNTNRFDLDDGLLLPWRVLHPFSNDRRYSGVHPHAHADTTNLKANFDVDGDIVTIKTRPRRDEILFDFYSSSGQATTAYQLPANLKLACHPLWVQFFHSLFEHRKGSEIRGVVLNPSPIYAKGYFNSKQFSTKTISYDLNVDVSSLDNESE